MCFIYSYYLKVHVKVGLQLRFNLKVSTSFGRLLPPPIHTQELPSRGRLWMGLWDFTMPRAAGLRAFAVGGLQWSFVGYRACLASHIVSELQEWLPPGSNNLVNVRWLWWLQDNLSQRICTGARATHHEIFRGRLTVCLPPTFLQTPKPRTLNRVQ